jgi:hypothetical protein
MKISKVAVLGVLGFAIASAAAPACAGDMYTGDPGHYEFYADEDFTNLVGVADTSCDLVTVKQGDIHGFVIFTPAAC